MDDTQPSRVSDVTATRKRRSSILKNQRPPRAPLSELEFNVATPTDSAKSRRVSFSRRTGVAEFVTNEATTTWKNFYEEHNKTLESSGNDSEVNARQSVRHLGRRIFDEQFQVETIDFATLSDGRGLETSITNIELLQTTTDDLKPTAPQHNLDLSTFTNQPSKFFGDDLNVSELGGITDKMDVNFSTFQPLSDDLDEMQKDLDRRTNNRKFPDRNALKYSKIDLNSTHLTLQGNDESDMSITDTIYSPKVNVSNNVISQVEKSTDWVADKENIVVNPYIAPKESANFAINEESDKVLVFDGKRLTIQSEKDPLCDYREALLDMHSGIPQIKTMVPDDCNNVPENLNEQASMYEYSKDDRVALDSSDLSMTQPLAAHLETVNKRKTLVYNNDCDISMTQALPTNIISYKEKRRTIVFDADISVTQAVSSNLIINNCSFGKEISLEEKEESENISSSQVLIPNILPEKSDNRKTILFSENTGNVSFTQAVSSNLILPEKRTADSVNLSVVSDLLDVVDIPMIKTDDKKQSRKTILFLEEAGNVSITQALPAKVIVSQEMNLDLLGKQATKPEFYRNTLVDDSDISSNESVLDLIPFDTKSNDNNTTNVIDKTKLTDMASQSKITKFEENTENVPHSSSSGQSKCYNESNLERDKSSVGTTDSITSRGKISIAFEPDLDISATQPLPTNIIDKSKSESKSAVECSNLSPKDSKRRDTIVYDDEDISMTQALPTNAVLAAIDDVIGDKSNNEIDFAEAGPSHLMSSSRNKSKVVYEDDGNISMTRALVSNIFLSATTNKSQKESELKIAEGKLDLSLATKNSDKRKTVVYENEDADISMTKALPTNVILSAINAYHNRVTETVVREEVHDKSVTQAPPKDTSNKNTTIIYGHNLADVSVTQVVPTNIPLNVVKTCDNKDLVTTQDSEEQFDVESLPEHSKWTDKYGLSSGKSSTTTITQGTEDKDYNEADVSMNESDESKHIAFAVDSKKEIGIERKSLATSVPIMKPNSNAVNPIPKDLLCLQKEILKAPLKKFTLESSRLQDVMIYQTCTSAVPRSEPGDQLPKASSSTTVSGTDTEIKETFFASINNITSNDSSSSGIDLQMSVAKSDAVTSDHQIRLDKSTSDSEKVYDGISQTSSVVSKIQSKVERSLFQHLLDMNDAVDAEGIDDKSLMAQTSLATVMSQPEVETKNTSSLSHESLFFITKDNSDKDTSEKSIDEMSVIRTLAKENLKAVEAQQIPLQIEFEHFIDDVGKSFDEFEKQSLHKTKPTNRYFEKVVSPQVDKRPKAYVKENSELLDMLSKFTEQEEKENPLEPLVNESLRSIPSPERITETFKIQYKQEKEPEDRIQKPLKLEYKPEKEQDNKQVKKLENPQPILIKKRQSVVLSREDIMNNISMAQAALQQTCGTNTTGNDTVDMYHDKSISPKKNVHLSPEVVKTLMFDEDESNTDIGLKHETGLSALLKKTAFGESSYMREELMNEHKSYVIPSYLKDVSDGIKALMTDLVKPSADVLPFDTSGDARLKKTTSTCSTQIQANLFQSSQIDLDQESNTGSMMSVSSPQRKLKGIIKSSINNSSSEHNSEQEYMNWVERDDSFNPSEFITDEKQEYTSFGRVLAFDPNNPLNNVLLAPIDFREAHKYEPSSDASYSDNEKAGHPIQVQFKDVDNSDLNNYNVPFVIPNFKDIHKGFIDKSAVNSKKGNKDNKLNPRKDNAVVTELDTKEEEVNTNIVMKDNQRLLNESSSLTLVDDTIATLDDDLSDLDTGTSKNVSRNSSKSSYYSASPAHLIYIQKVEKPPASDPLASEKIKKRKQSDRHRSCLSSYDVSPRMMSKVIKRARKKKILSPQFIKENTDTSEYDKSSSPPQSPPKVDALHVSNSRRSVCGKNRKPGTIITVKRLVAEYDIQAIPAEIPNSNPLSVHWSAKSDIISTNSSISSRSSKGRADKGDAQSISSVCVKDMYSTDWSPEMLKKLSSRSLVEECDSNSDIVSRIHALPFIGSRECQWESLSSDQWSFRLLLGRLRLTFRLAVPPENTAWGRIQPNTPVSDVMLDAHVHNMKNSIAVLCVNFAAEAMRYIIGKGCAQAKDVPVLLRRCAGIARVALGWGRAMHVAWTQLAFKLTNEGELTLKVANIPLRAVWEVSMSLSLVVEDAREVPWPRAARVRVVPALPGSAPVCVRKLRAQLRRQRRDWGHAPRALWAIFKHLKYLTHDDEYLFAK